MKKGIWVILASAVALVLQTTMARFVIGGTTALDLVLIVVVYVALTLGPVSGLFAGTVAGLAQDALSSGVIGVGGLAKTVVGFVTGVVATQFIVGQALPRFVVFWVATVVHAAIFIGLYALMGVRSFSSPYVPILGQALGNAVVGVVAFRLIESLPVALERRRSLHSVKPGRWL